MGNFQTFIKSYENSKTFMPAMPICDTVCDFVYCLFLLTVIFVSILWGFRNFCVNSTEFLRLLTWIFPWAYLWACTVSSCVSFHYCCCEHIATHADAHRLLTCLRMLTDCSHETAHMLTCEQTSAHVGTDHAHSKASVIQLTSKYWGTNSFRSLKKWILFK